MGKMDIEGVHMSKSHSIALSKQDLEICVWVYAAIMLLKLCKDTHTVMYLSVWKNYNQCLICLESFNTSLLWDSILHIFAVCMATTGAQTLESDFWMTSLNVK